MLKSMTTPMVNNASMIVNSVMAALFTGLPFSGYTNRMAVGYCTVARDADTTGAASPGVVGAGVPAVVAFAAPLAGGVLLATGSCGSRRGRCCRARLLQWDHQTLAVLDLLRIRDVVGVKQVVGLMPYFLAIVAVEYLKSTI